MKYILLFYLFFYIVRNTLIVTFLTSSYFDLFENFYSNLKILGLEQNLHVFSTFAPLFFKSNQINFTLLNITFLNSENSDKEQLSRTYGSHQWNRLNLIKGSIFSSLTKKFESFIYSDPDVIWFQNAFESMKKNCLKDLCFQSDSKFDIPIKTDNNANAGFFYVKRSKISISFMDEWKRACLTANASLGSDQKLLNKIVRSSLYIDKTQLLDRKKFANGKYLEYFEKCPKINGTRLITLHNNWILGKKSKIDRAKKCGYWFC